MEIIKQETTFGSVFGYCSEGSFYWHREDGPAFILPDGSYSWWFHNNNIDAEMYQWLKEHNIDDWEVMTDEDKLALSFFMRSCEDEELPVVNISN